jgi:hypothetical protein
MTAGELTKADNASDNLLDHIDGGVLRLQLADPSGRNEMKPVSYDRDRLDSVAERLAGLLGEVLAQNQALQKESARVRTQILADLRPAIEATPVEDRGAILSYLIIRMQAIFDQQGSPKVELSGGCAGAEGGGIRVTEGGAYAGACVTGSLSEGPTGGGVEGGFTY